MKETKCDCGATIVFATNPATGKKVPLQSIKGAFYRLCVTDDYMGRGVTKADAIPEPGVYINHFITCPLRDKFKKAKT